MRRFVVAFPSTAAASKVDLHNLADGGRFDLVARCAMTGLLTSHGIRSDTVLELHLGGPPPLTLTLDGRKVTHLHPSERAAAGLLQEALSSWYRVAPPMTVPVDTTPGITARGEDFGRLLDRLEQPIILLDESAPAHAGAMPPGTFLVGGHRGLGMADLAALAVQPQVLRVGLGPVHYHADAVLSVVHYLLDTHNGAVPGGFGGL